MIYGNTDENRIIQKEQNAKQKAAKEKNNEVLLQKKYSEAASFIGNERQTVV